MSKYDALSQYAEVEQTSISEATPHGLILLLFDGAIISVRIAIQQMEEKNIPGKGEAISKALAIVDEGLRASLNKEKGGEIAENLDALYEYMCNQLIRANLDNDPEPLREVLRLLEEIREAWHQIGSAPAAPAVAEQEDAPPAKGGHSYGKA